jgi:hypothetical protein
MLKPLAHMIGGGRTWPRRTMRRDGPVDIGSTRRRSVFASSTILAAALMTLGIRQTDAAASRNVVGHTARELRVTDTAHLHYVKESGSQIIDEGEATGTLPGDVRVSFNVGVTVEATFTISEAHAHDWSITGHGSGELHKNKSKSDVYVSFGGTMAVAHGTGRYAHAHGTGGFYGVIDRSNYAVTIQTTGTLAY